MAENSQYPRATEPEKQKQDKVIAFLMIALVLYSSFVAAAVAFFLDEKVVKNGWCN